MFWLLGLQNRDPNRALRCLKKGLKNEAAGLHFGSEIGGIFWRPPGPSWAPKKLKEPPREAAKTLPKLPGSPQKFFPLGLVRGGFYWGRVKGQNGGV